MQQDGWEIVLFYLWIPSASFSRERVRERVRQGGHNIPDEVIRRRYPKSIRNLIKYYAPLCDQIFCYDNSSSEPRLIFSQEQEGLQIRDSEVYQYIERYQDDHE
jgi:predicted ABC-type ATPase